MTMPEEPAPVSGSAADDVRRRAPRRARTLGPVGADHPHAGGRPVQKPVLNDVRIDLPPRAADVGARSCPAATLTVEVSWDWADRSPDRIEVSGRVRAARARRRCRSAGSRSDSAGPVGSFAVTIGFDAAGAPSVRVPTAPPTPPAGAVATAQSASVAEVADPQSAPGSGPPPRLGGQPGPPLPADPAGVAVLRGRRQAGVRRLRATAAEAVRPADLSGPTEPRATTVADPFPRPRARHARR